MDTQEAIESIANLEFTSAYQVCREYAIPRKIAKLIVSQPGYQTGSRMCISKASTGGYRLYVRVDTTWMDASLKDI